MINSSQLFQTSPIEPNTALLSAFDTFLYYIKYERFMEEYQRDIDWQKKERTSVILTSETKRKDESLMASFFKQLVLLHVVDIPYDTEMSISSKKKIHAYFYDPQSLNKQFLRFDITKVKENKNQSYYSLDMTSAKDINSFKQAMQLKSEPNTFYKEDSLFKVRYYFEAHLNEPINEDILHKVEASFEKYYLNLSVLNTDETKNEVKTKKMKI
jgi:hypothetical protein